MGSGLLLEAAACRWRRLWRVVDPVAQMQYPVVPAFGKELLALLPDPYSSYTYAATAARAATVLRANAAQLQRLTQSAAKAFDWAERQPRDSFASRTLINAVRDRRNLAAAELLRLTGSAQYRDVFAETTCLKTSANAYKGGADGFDQREAVFVYVRLPEASVDVQLRQAALVALKNDADQAMAITQGNAWGLCGEAGSPAFYSTQAVQSLLHGHYILKNEAYLKWRDHARELCSRRQPGQYQLRHRAGMAVGAEPDASVYPPDAAAHAPWAGGARRGGSARPGVMDDPTIKDAIAPLCQRSLDQWPAADACWMFMSPSRHVITR